MLFFAAVWALGVCCRLCRSRSGALVRRRHGHGTASCTSKGGRGISCTIVHQACAVRCAGAVRAVIPTDARWTHASPRTSLESAISLSGFSQTYFWGDIRKICFAIFFATLIVFAMWARSTVGISRHQACICLGCLFQTIPLHWLCWLLCSALFRQSFDM